MNGSDGQKLSHSGDVNSDGVSDVGRSGRAHQLDSIEDEERKKLIDDVKRMPKLTYQTIFYELGWNSSKYVNQTEELLKWKDQIIFEISCLLRRSLDPFEMQCILFPKLCAICLNDDPFCLTPCPDCHTIFFCPIHRSELTRHTSKVVPNLKFHPCRPVKNSSPKTARSPKPSELALAYKESENVSLCSLLRYALECDRKEQLLGIENVDEILTPYFNHSSAPDPVMSNSSGTLEWISRFLGDVGSSDAGAGSSSHILNNINNEKDNSLPIVSEISRMLLSDPVSYPLSLIDAIRKIFVPNDAVPAQTSFEIKKLVIHVIGSEAHRELLGLSRWEIVLHEFPISEIEFVFIGSALECDLDEGIGEGEEDDGTNGEDGTKIPPTSSVLYYQRKCGYWDTERCYLTINGDQLICHHCRAGGKHMMFRLFPYMSYEEFAVYWSEKSSDSRPSWTKPDLVVAFNCGFHVATDDVEVWDAKTMMRLINNNILLNNSSESPKDAPLLFTSLNLSECEQDLKFLEDQIAVDVIIPPCINPYSSSRPIRDATGRSSSICPTIYVANGAYCLVAGKS